MTQQYDDTNRGALFKNEKKSDTHPDYKGSLNVGGVEFWLSSWIKTSKDGKKYMSLSVQPKDERANSAPGKPASTATLADDDIPF